MSKIEVRQSTNSNIDEWLNINFKLFNLSDIHIQNMVRLKYYSAENAIKYVEMYDSNEKIGHIAYIKQSMYLGSIAREIAFLTSVYIYPKFRNNGYLLPLLTAAEEFAKSEQNVASIIVARRAVKDMYSKYGYFGFSVFPSVSLNQHLLKNRNLSTPVLALSSKQLDEIYIQTYLNINGTLRRNLLYWESIAYGIKHRLIGLFKDISTESYILTKNSTAIEIAGNTENLMELIHDCDVKRFLISRDHPSFKMLMNLGGEYSHRPEPKEGHLCKVLHKNSEFGKLLLSFELADYNLKDMNFKPLNLLELNQW